MKTFLNIIIFMLLILNGVGAIYGGSNLIMQPDGSGLGFTTDLLANTIFPDFLIPGIVLFIANGLCSLWVSMAVVLNYKNNAWFVMAQGAILAGWIIIQVIMLQTIYPLHIIMGSMGFALILLGWLQHRLPVQQE